MVRSEVLKLWEQALKILEKKLNKNSFDTWLKPLIPLGCHESTIIIEVPNNFSRGWLSDRYAPLLKNVIQDIIKQDIGIQFLLSSGVPHMENSQPQKNIEKAPHEKMRKIFPQLP